MFLNGSAVSVGEREDAERFFIRFYQDCPEQELTERYARIHHFTFNSEVRPLWRHITPTLNVSGVV